MPALTPESSVCLVPGYATQFTAKQCADITVALQCRTEQLWFRGAMTRALLYLQVSVRSVMCRPAFLPACCLFSCLSMLSKMLLTSPH